MRTGAFLLVLLLFAEDDYTRSRHTFFVEKMTSFFSMREMKKKVASRLSLNPPNTIIIIIIMIMMNVLLYTDKDTVSLQQNATK